ncbi:MAG: tRNA (guanine(6)-N2)-methyltransferase [Nitrososphaerota archaeon]
MEEYIWFATTVTGLEDVATKEIEELTNVEAEPDVGKVFFKGSLEDAAIVNYSSRIVNRVFLLLARGPVSTLDDVYKIARSIDYREYVNPTQSFAVKAERQSKQLPFTSMDAAAKVGSAVIESFREKTSVRLKVNLDNPDVEFYCLLRDSEMLLGLNITGQSLHRRYYRVFHHRATLQPTIASAMIEISKWEGEDMLDPMCGSGTIPIEAAIRLRKIPPGLMKNRLNKLKMENLKIFTEEILEKARGKVLGRMELWRNAKIVGSDVSHKNVVGALKNVEAAEVQDIVRLLTRDIFKMDEWLDFTPSIIITNPPYGIRMGISNIEEFYRKFIKTIKKTVPDAKITIIISKPTLFTKILIEENYTVTHKREIMYGRLRTSILTAQR